LRERERERKERSNADGCDAGALLFVGGKAGCGDIGRDGCALATVSETGVFAAAGEGAILSSSSAYHVAAVSSYLAGGTPRSAVFSWWFWT
jgi:hypothetical protein